MIKNWQSTRVCQSGECTQKSSSVNHHGKIEQSSSVAHQAQYAHHLITTFP